MHIYNQCPFCSLICTLHIERYLTRPALAQKTLVPLFRESLSCLPFTRIPTSRNLGSTFWPCPRTSFPHSLCGRTCHYLPRLLVSKSVRAHPRFSIPIMLDFYLWYRHKGPSIKYVRSRTEGRGGVQKSAKFADKQYWKCGRRGRGV